AFTYFKLVGVTRHHGQLFMVLISACWLAARTPQWAPAWRWLDVTTRWFDRWRGLMLGILLSAHVVGGIGANIAGIYLPFSAGKEVAQYIQQKLPPDVTLVGIDDYCMSPIAAYLGRDFYFP